MAFARDKGNVRRDDTQQQQKPTCKTQSDVVVQIQSRYEQGINEQIPLITAMLDGACQGINNIS